MDDATKANRPRHLVDWPVVLVGVECSLCPRRGRYRLARLAERYGAVVPLLRLLELIAADCALMKLGEKPHQYEARCGIRYVVPPAEPLPLDAPARAGERRALVPQLRSIDFVGAGTPQDRRSRYDLRRNRALRIRLPRRRRGR